MPRSDKATLIEYFIRHGEYLTLVTIVKDPVYLTEPFVRTSNWVARSGISAEPVLVHPDARDRARRAAKCRIICPARTRTSRIRARGTGCRQKRRAAEPRRCTRTI